MDRKDLQGHPLERSHLVSVQGYQASSPIPYDAAIIKLNSNENPYPPSPRVLEVLGNIDSEYLRRYPDPHTTSFRAVVGKLLAIAPDWICVGNGADHLLDLIFQGFVERGDRVVYPSPTYGLYPVLCQLNGAEQKTWEFYPKGGLPVDNLIQAQGKVTLIASPTSPTGQAIAMTDLEHLAQSLQGILVIDEAYCDFATGDALPLVRQYPHVILIRTLSKGYSLAGLRLGFAIAHPDIITVLNKVKDTYSVDAIALMLGETALKDQPYKDAVVSRIKRSRQTLRQGLESRGWNVHPSATNFLWTQPPGNAEQIAQMLKEQQIYIRHYSAPKLRNHVRITVGTEAQNKKLLQVLRSSL